MGAKPEDIASTTLFPSQRTYSGISAAPPLKNFTAPVVALMTWTIQSWTLALDPMVVSRSSVFLTLLQVGEKPARLGAMVELSSPGTPATA